MFIRHERSIKEFMINYPIVFTLIIIHLILWFIIDFLQLPIGFLIESFGVGSNYLVDQGEYWRLFTPIFLHGGFGHMIFNSFSLVLFGPALEQMLGKGKFLLAYFGAGIIGNIGTFIFGPLDYWHLGASGSIFGLFGIYIFMVMNRKHLIDQGSAQMITMILVIGVLMTFFRSGINIYAHLFGFIGGFLLAPIVLQNVRPYSPWRIRRARTTYDDDADIQFDPNRWNKRSWIPDKLRKNWFIGVIIALALIGLFSRFF